MERQLQPSIYTSKSRGNQILLKTTQLSDDFVCHFPRVFKNEITMQFRRQLSHASFSRGLCIFVKKSSACITICNSIPRDFFKILNKGYCVARD